jgi:hypothetical protein
MMFRPDNESIRLLGGASHQPMKMAVASILVVGTFICLTDVAKSQRTQRDASLIKQPKDLAMLQTKALHGDKDAAWTVFIHYNVGLHDEVKAEPWLRLALKLKNQNAVHYLEVRAANKRHPKR